MKKKTNKWVEFGLCVCLGYFGVHRFYAKRKCAVLWLCTFGLCGVGWMIDSIILFVEALQSTKKKPAVQQPTTTQRQPSAVEQGLAKRKAHFQNLLNTDPSKVLCFDIETTGIDKRTDEVLQLSIIDGNGKVLFNDYVRPAVHTEWPDAERIHGISPSMVAGKRTMKEIAPEINRIMANAAVLVGYNSNGFDIPFLQNNGIQFPENAEKADVMLMFAIIYGQWDSYHGDYKWQKLTTCAQHYGYEFKAHDSLEDIKATLYCYYKIVEGYARGE